MFTILRQIIPLKKNYSIWSLLARQTNFHTMCTLCKMAVLIRRDKLMLRHDMNRLYVSTKLTAVLDLYRCCFKLTLHRKFQLLKKKKKTEPQPLIFGFTYKTFLVHLEDAQHFFPICLPNLNSSNTNCKYQIAQLYVLTSMVKMSRKSNCSISRSIFTSANVP